MSRSDDIACQQVVELLTDYLEGAMADAELERLEAQLRGCDGCTRVLAQLKETIRLTGRLTEDAISAAQKEVLLEMFRTWKQTPTD
jgi:anti-sigma factor RsiW